MEKQCYSNLNMSRYKEQTLSSFEFNMVKKTNLIKEKSNGFSLVDLIIVLLIISILVLLALPQVMTSRRLLRFAGVQKQIVSVLREARQEAMAQQKPITFRYDNTSKSIVIYGGVFGAINESGNRTYHLDGDGVTKEEIVYGRPDGASIAALGDRTNLTNLVDNAIEVTFRSDGSVVDASNNPQNNALFFYSSETPAESAFAVSILGAGGRTKFWRFMQGPNIYVE